MGKNLFTLAGKGKPGGRTNFPIGLSRQVRVSPDQGVRPTSETGISSYPSGAGIWTIPIHALPNPSLLEFAPISVQSMRSVLSVHFYRNTAGKEPVRNWLTDELPSEARKAIGTDIKTVQLGWPIGMPVVRKMESGLWEVRSRIPEGTARVFFTIVETRMVLLHGFVKKTRTTRERISSWPCAA